MKQTASTIPLKMRAEMERDPFYHQCARNAALHDHTCQCDPIRGTYGRMIEWEHALIYAGQKVQEKFAIVPICWWSHRGPGFDKNINIWLALNRATDSELQKISEKGGQDYFKLRDYLNGVYGVYNPVENYEENLGIASGLGMELDPVFHNVF